MGQRIWIAVSCITVASVLLSLDLKGQWGISLSAIGVLVACVLWAIDNNLTRHVSAKDPVVIVIFKGVGAGLFSLALAFILSTPVPSPWLVLSAMLLGFFSYGLSLVFFILSMRSLGAARTSAFFGTAPFIGVVISLALLKESPDLLFTASFPIMVLGAVLLLSEKHGHEHFHEAIVHEHRHDHEDGHHAHNHQEQIPAHTSHSHPHEHETTEHSHVHTPDIHHRHR
jgi:drug/metabolite transporter (DMT)-like permease